MTDLTVTFDNTVHIGQPTDIVTFGRAADCTVCLDPEDLSVSRRAGAFEFVHDGWRLTNRSTSRPLSVIDERGLRKVLGPGQRLPVEEPIWVLVEGTRSHRIRVDVPISHPQPEQTLSPGLPTVVGEKVLVTAAERRTMAALFVEYLRDPPEAVPKPRSYHAAAARLGEKRSTVLKRIEYLRARLTAAGAPSLTGHNALENLAEYALSRRLVTKDDLRQ